MSEAYLNKLGPFLIPDNNLPISIGKLGGIEAAHCAEYLKSGIPKRMVEERLYINAGIYCKNEQSLISWLDNYLLAVKDLDYVLPWCKDDGDSYVIDSVGTGKLLHSFSQIEPFDHGEDGWHYRLGDKRVLCVSQLKDTIGQQVNRYSEIWPGAKIGSCVVIGAGYSEALTGLPPIDWQTKIDILKEEILKTEFDCAVVGAGGYSLEVCRFIKAMGKSCIHIGGGTQLLFGIRGKRWDRVFHDKDWYGAQAWVRPMFHEIPEKQELVEGGCYW